MAGARQAGVMLHSTGERIERDRNDKAALRWLSENRESYKGQWIALQGSSLLAVGQTAREVYDKVREQRPRALVIKVETEELPFGGW